MFPIPIRTIWYITSAGKFKNLNKYSKPKPWGKTVFPKSTELPEIQPKTLMQRYLSQRLLKTFCCLRSIHAEVLNILLSVYKFRLYDIFTFAQHRSTDMLQILNLLFRHSEDIWLLEDIWRVWEESRKLSMQILWDLASSISKNLDLIIWISY